MKWAVETCDIVRLDHFRGYEACWEIPADEPTAENGHWVAGPNDDLFKTLKSALGKLPFIAEDLGYITPEVRALRKKLDVPGMKVMQFGFGDRGAHIYLPHMFTPDSVVYTGTTTTTPRWWGDRRKREERWAIEHLEISATESSGRLSALPSLQCQSLAVVPMQDVLGLNGDARMNIPKPGGNWSWRSVVAALTQIWPNWRATEVPTVHVKDPRDSPRPGHRFRSMSSTTRWTWRTLLWYDAERTALLIANCLHLFFLSSLQLGVAREWWVGLASGHDFSVRDAATYLLIANCLTKSERTLWCQW